MNPGDSQPRPVRKNNKNKKKKSKGRNKSSPTFQHFTRLSEANQRRIIECAYYAGYTPASALVLVCKKFRSWIEPLMYEYIIIDDSDGKCQHRLENLARTFNETPNKSTDFFAQNVKGILINGTIQPIVTDILSIVGDNITSFACYTQSGIEDETTLQKLDNIFSSNPFSNLRHFSFSGIGFEASEIQKPMFHNLTHLAIDVGNNHNDFPWAELKNHDHLTHLLIDVNINLQNDMAPLDFRSIITDILPHLPSKLECFVVLVGFDELVNTMGDGRFSRAVLLEVIEGRLDQRLILAAYNDKGEERITEDNIVRDDKEKDKLLFKYYSYVPMVPQYAVPWVCLPDGRRRDVWRRAEETMEKRRKEIKVLSDMEGFIVCVPLE